MERWRGKVAVVTGASSGIGKLLATKLVEEGMIVAGLARRKERIDELAITLQGCKGILHSIQADVTKEEDIVKAFQYIVKNLGPVHVLINNAGLARMSPLSVGKTEQWKLVMDTNVMGLSIATREALQNMFYNKVNGHIIHISSIVGHTEAGNPNGFYGASKAAVLSLTESLRYELNAAKSKIKISCVSPGHVETEFMEIVRNTNDNPRIQKYLDTFIQNAPALEAEDVADCILYVLGTPPHVQIHDIVVRPSGEGY